MTSSSEEKWKISIVFSVHFQSREQVVVRRVPIRGIGWMIKIVEPLEGQFLVGCKCPVRRGIVVQEQVTLFEYAAAFFLQNVFQFHQQVSLIPALIIWPFGK